MRYIQKASLSAVALSVIAATANAQTFETAELQVMPVNANSMTAVNADFSQWREEQKFQSSEFTDRIIVKYKNGFEAQALSNFSSEKVMPAGLAKKAGHSLKHLKKLKNGRHVISLGKQKHINDVKAMVNGT